MLLRQKIDKIRQAGTFVSAFLQNTMEDGMYGTKTGISDDG
jgi:hypothetical protein